MPPPLSSSRCRESITRPQSPVIRVGSLLWHQVIRAGRAFFEMLRQSGTCHVLPVLCLGEQLSASVRMIRSTLSAERSHCAHAAYSFHSNLPYLFARIGMLRALRRMLTLPARSMRRRPGSSDEKVKSCNRARRSTSACAAWGAESMLASLAARTLALSALAPSDTGTIGSDPLS